MCGALQAIEIFNESGRFQQAGKMLTEIGDIYKEEGNYSEAVEAWQEASDYLAVRSLPLLDHIMFYTVRQ